MKKYIAMFLTVVFFVIAFAGCTADKTVPFTARQVNRDFEITLKADDTVYKKSELSQDNLFKIVGEIKYSGKENVTIYHGNPVFVIGMVDLKDKSGADITTAAQQDILTNTKFTPGQTLAFEWTGDTEYKLIGGYEKGIYTVNAFYDFIIGEDGEKISGSFNIPIVIE